MNTLDNCIYEFEAYNEFEEVINDIEAEVEILGMKYPAGSVLRKMDPIAFRGEMLNYYDDMGVEVI